MARADRKRWRDWAVAGVLVTLGAGLLIAQYRALEQNRANQRDRVLLSVASRMDAGIRAELARAEAAVRSAAALLEGVPDIAPAAFNSFAERSLREQAAMRALQWEPRVLEGERAAFEAHWRARGLPDFALRDPGPDGLQPARARPVSYPILMGHAVGEMLPLGLVAATELSVESPPLADEPLYLQTATLSQSEARDQAAPRMTGRFEAVTADPDPAVPAAFRQAAFSIRMPVYVEDPGESVEARRALLRGYAVGFVALPSLLGEARALAESERIDFRLRDLGAAELPLYAHENASSGAAFEVEHRHPLRVLGRDWVLELAAVDLAAGSALWLQLQLLSGLLALGAAAWLLLRALAAKRELEQAQRRLRSLTDGLPLGVFQAGLGADGLQIQYVNRGAAALVGLDEETLVHAPQRLFDVIDPDERAALFGEMRAALTAARAVKRELLANVDGQSRRLLLSAVPSESGAGAVLKGVLEDVTALREAGALIEAFAAEQAIMVESLPFGLLFAEAGRIVRCNPALAQLFGYVRTDELVDRPLLSLHPDEADYRALRKDAGVRLKAGKVYTGERQLVRRDGEPFLARLVGRKLIDDEHGRELWVVIDAASRSAHEAASA